MIRDVVVVIAAAASGLCLGLTPAPDVGASVDWPLIFQAGILTLCVATFWEVRKHGIAIAVLEAEGRERAHAVRNLRQDVSNLRSELALRGHRGHVTEDET